MRKLLRWIYPAVFVAGAYSLCAQAAATGVEVRTKVDIQLAHEHAAARQVKPNLSNVVVWLSPAQPLPPNPAATPHPAYQLAQKNKQFHPHLLVVPTGSSVEFPNLDPFFHNVFSLFNGKRFDLGLYEAGAHRYVQFDREGVSYIFCNIHPEMGAVVLALSTPYYAISGADGTSIMRNVLPGTYHLHVWSENALSSLDEQGRLVQVGTDDLRLEPVSLQRTPNPLMNHKNKFGEDYQATPANPY